jgi:hypothetical protein
MASTSANWTKAGGLPPPVIPRFRTVTLGGETFLRETLVKEIRTQSLADVRSMIRGITFEETNQQLRIGNPPTLLEVDARTGKRVEDVDKRTVVLYGVMLAASAMREVEMELAGAIARSTTMRSGQLGNVGGNWQWLYIPKGGAPRPTTPGNAPPFFGAGDRLVLVPKDIGYATLTNRNVARGGRLVAPIGRKGRPAKSKQNRGYFFWAAEGVRKRIAFKQFHVRVVFSKAHMVAGELMTRTSGTGMIVISPRVRRVRI